MKRLLGIELAKLLPYRAFRVLMVIYLLGFVAMPWSMETIPWLRNMQQFFEFPAIWAFYYQGAVVLSLALVIITVTFTAQEYSHRTLRQNVIDGMSRDEAFAGKALLLVLLWLGLTVLFFLNGLIAGCSNAFSLSEVTGRDIFRKGGYIGGFFLHAMGIMSLCLFLATWIRRTGLAIFGFLGWIILEFILRGVLRGVVRDRGIVSDHLPMRTIFHSHFELPDPDTWTNIFDVDTLIPTAGLGWENTVWKLIYIGVFLGWSWRMTRRRDL